MLVEQGCDTAHLIKNQPSKLCPTNQLTLAGSFSSNMDDVELNLFRAKLTISLCFVAASWISSFKVKSCVEETLQHANPRIILTVMKCKCEKTSGFQYSVRLPPTIS